MQTYTSPDPLPTVTARLNKAGEGFWNSLHVGTAGNTLAIECGTLWKDGPLWRFQGGWRPLAPPPGCTVS